jgi:transposase
MRFVPTKTPEQQSCLMLHRTRHLLIRQQTALINSIRAHLAEFGIVAPVGRNGVEQLLEFVADANDARLPSGHSIAASPHQERIFTSSTGSAQNESMLRLRSPAVSL